MNAANLAIVPNDLVTIKEAAENIGRPQTSVGNKVRNGSITVHFVVGDSQAKVSLSEVQELFKTVPRRRARFSAPTYRIVRHEERPVSQEPEALPKKSDLFA